MVPTRSRSVPLDRVDRLTDDEESDLEVVNSTRNRAYTKKYVSTELDTDQGEGMMQKLKFAAKHLNDKIQLHTSGTFDEFRELLLLWSMINP